MPTLSTRPSSWAAAIRSDRSVEACAWPANSVVPRAAVRVRRSSVERVGFTVWLHAGGQGETASGLVQKRLTGGTLGRQGDTGASVTWQMDCLPPFSTNVGIVGIPWNCCHRDDMEVSLG